MSIDWFTVAAQTINFIVLVLLLRLLLYKRVLRAIDARRETIDGRLEQADRARSEARADRKRAERELRDQHAERAERLKRDAEEIEAHRAQLIDEAHAEAEAARRRWREQLRRQQRDLAAELTQVAGDGICRAVERVLRDLTGETLQTRTIDTLVAKLTERGDGDGSPPRGRLLAELAGDTPRLSVCSAAELSEADRGRLTEAVRAQLPEAKLSFSRDPSLLVGVEIRGDGYAIGWNARDYLEQLSRTLEAELRVEQQQAKR